MGAVNIMVVQVGMFDSLESEVLGSRRSESEPHGRMQAACPQQSAAALLSSSRFVSVPVRSADFAGLQSCASERR